MGITIEEGHRTMTLITSGELGATRQTWRAKSVRDLLVEIVTTKPQASDQKLLKAFIAHLREDDDYFLAAAEYAFDNALRALRREQLRPAAAVRRAEQVVARTKLVATIKAKILLNLRMPNGKPLRHCTGAECEHFGGLVQPSRR
jgi:hypothetical protein